MAAIKEYNNGEYYLIARNKKKKGKIANNEKIKNIFIIKNQENVRYKNNKRYLSYCGLIEVGGISIITPRELISKRIKFRVEVV